MAEMYEGTIQTFLVEELFDGETPDGLNTSTLLIEEGLLDSLGIFETVGWIEENYSVDIPPENVVIEHFRTIADIARLVASSVAD